MILHRVPRYWALVRPFTLLPPAIGMLSGAICSVGSYAARQQLSLREAGDELGGYDLLSRVGIGIIAATCLNAGSNILNQIYDIDADRLNKPNRVLVTGQLTIQESAVIALCLFFFANVFALFVSAGNWWEVSTLFLIATLCTIAYSVPPLRLKSRGWFANFTIAIPRGLLLKVAGWGTATQIAGLEPWFIGMIFMLFLIGASSSKDFSDIKGDRLDNVRTLPVLYGPERTVKLIAPYFFLPWLLIPFGLTMSLFHFGEDILHGSPLALLGLTVLLAAYGKYTVNLMANDPKALAKTENHPSWFHMYFIMMLAQIGFAVCYMF